MSNIKKNALIVEETLKAMGEPIRLRDLVELTKDSIEWREQKKQAQQMITFMNNVPTIAKSRQYGSYVYLPEGEKELLKRGRKPKSDKAKAKAEEEKKKIKEKVDEVAKNIEENEDKTEDKNLKVEPTAPEPPEVTDVINERKDGDTLIVNERDQMMLEDFRKFTAPVLQDKQEKEEEKKKFNYKNGDTFEGVVTGVEDYGAFVENEDGKIQGLVHISNMKKGVVDDPQRHFKLGDRVKAKVIGVKAKGKLSLSTRHITLPDYFLREEYVQQFQEYSQHVEEEERKDESKLENEVQVIGEDKMEVIEPTTTKNSSHTDEHEEIFKFIQSITGVVSNPAKEKLMRMIEKEGVFKFTMALSEAKKDFEVDVSMLFAQELEQKMSGHL